MLLDIGIASFMQQIVDTFAVLLIKPVPDLLPVCTGREVEVWFLDLLGHRVHGNVSKLLPQALDRGIVIV